MVITKIYKGAIMEYNTSIAIFSALCLFIAWHFAYNYIYPHRIRKRIKALENDIYISEKDEYVFKAQIWAYVEYIVIFIMFAGWIFGIVYTVISEDKIDIVDWIFMAVAFVICCGLAVFAVIELIVRLPKRQFAYRNGEIYYRNGRKEYILNEVEYMYEHTSCRTSCWMYDIKLKDKKRHLYVDILSLHNPEIIHFILERKVKII